MAASEAAVTAVMETLGCERVQFILLAGEPWKCAQHRFWEWTDRGCHVAFVVADAAVDADRASIQAETRRETFAEASRAMNRVADIWERDGSDRCRVRVNRENANAYRLYAEGLGEPTGSRKETKP